MQDTETKILKNLAIYKFLTVSQFQAIGIKVSKKTLYKILKMMREPKMALIGNRIFRYNPKYGRVEDVHYLKPRGKIYLERQEGMVADDIKMPIGKTLFYNDYQHRKSCIDIHISIRKCIAENSAEIDFYDNYFEGRRKNNGRGRETATKVNLQGDKFIRADSIFQIDYKKTFGLYCLELHNGNRVIKICDQLKLYVEAIASGSISLKYNLTAPCRILVVFENISTLKTTIERLRAVPIFDHMRSYFLFTTIDALHTNPIACRISIAGERVNLLDPPNNNNK